MTTGEKDMKTRKNLRIWGTLFLAALVLYLPLEAGAQSQNDKDLLGDTARGAAKGAVIGGIAGDAGKGAAAGAVGGTLVGGMRRRRR